MLFESFNSSTWLNSRKTFSVVSKVIKTSLLHPPTTRVNWEPVSSFSFCVLAKKLSSGLKRCAESSGFTGWRGIQQLALNNCRSKSRKINCCRGRAWRRVHSRCPCSHKCSRALPTYGCTGREKLGERRCVAKGECSPSHQLTRTYYIHTSKYIQTYSM